MPVFPDNILSAGHRLRCVIGSPCLLNGDAASAKARPAEMSP